jgi:uncharacterized repeat protein (TIGR01451 family)
MHDEQQKLPALLLSPRGPYRVGDTFRASWSMTNFADHDLVGARLVFNLPASVDPILANSTIADARGEAIAAAFTPGGLALGTVRRGDSINAVLDLSFARESSAPHGFSAALHLGDKVTYESDPVELASRSRALLALAGPPSSCDIDLAARRLSIAFTLQNVGEMRVERIDLSVPTPAGFVLSRVRLSSGNAVSSGKEPFRLPDIARGESLDVVLEFEARGEISGHVEIDGLRLTYAGGSLFLDPVAVPLDRPEGALEGTLRTDSTTIEPGSVIRLDLAITNTGRSDAPGVTVAFVLPPELMLCSGTIAVNGGCDARRNDPASIPVGTVVGRSSSLVSMYATVLAPLEHDDRLTLGATIENQPVTPLELVVKSEPAFRTASQVFEIDGPAVMGAGETRTVRVRAANIGTADASGVRVRLMSPHVVIERASILRSDGSREEVAMKATVSRDGVACSVGDLGTVAARDIKTLEAEVRAPDHFGDGDTFALRADLRYAGGREFDLGEIAIGGRCRPAIDARESGLTSSRTEPLRVGQVRSYTLRVKNAGLAAARGVAVSLNLPGMLAIDAINGEPARSDVVTIREIPAGAAVEVPVALRLIESIDGGSTVDITPVVSGDLISTLRLEPARIATTGSAFLDEFVTRADKRSGELVASLNFRNVGDATAQHVVVSAVDLPADYVAESTRLNDVPVPDFGGTSLLVRGITLPPLAPGREIVLTYRLNDDADDVRVAFLIRSRSQDEILPEPAFYPSPRKKRQGSPFRTDVPRFIDVLPELATNGHSSNGHSNNGHHVAPLEVMPLGEPMEAHEPSAPMVSVATIPQAHGLVGYVQFDAREVAAARRVVEMALALPALGTYRHFFAMRAFVPSALLGASPEVCAAWRTVYERARADLSGPFVQAAVPGFEAGMAWAEQFHDASSGKAAATAIAAIRRAAVEDVPYEDTPVPNDQLRGPIGNEFENYLSAASEPNGNHFNLILAEALPTESPRDPQLAKSLKRYRERLKLLFAALLYQTPSARHERMLSGLDVELDDTLRAIADRFGDPRWA